MYRRWDRVISSVMEFAGAFFGNSSSLPAFWVMKMALVEEFAFMPPSCTRGDVVFWIDQSPLVDLLVLYLRDDGGYIVTKIYIIPISIRRSWYIIPWWVKIKWHKLHFFTFFKKYSSYVHDSISFWKYNVLCISGMFSRHFWTISDDFQIWWKKSFFRSYDTLEIWRHPSKTPP